MLRFLDAGNKVKITIMFRGREMAHPERGLTILERLADDLKDVAVISQPKWKAPQHAHAHPFVPSAMAAEKKKKNDSKKEEEGKDSNA